MNIVLGDVVILDGVYHDLSESFGLECIWPFLLQTQLSLACLYCQSGSLLRITHPPTWTLFSNHNGVITYSGLSVIAKEEFFVLLHSLVALIKSLFICLLEILEHFQRDVIRQRRRRGSSGLDDRLDDWVV